MEKQNIGKHAYLIIAHHRPDLLKLLLASIDDARNDVFLHIDEDSLGEMHPEDFSMDKAALYVIPQISVNWGGYSQVCCALNLLEEALNSGEHYYYHLITGATYPLQTQDHIYAFFDENQGMEFIDMDMTESPAPTNSDDYDRVRYYHIFNEIGPGLESSNIKNIARLVYIAIQRLLGVDRFAKLGRKNQSAKATEGKLIYKRGLAYWSITQDLAEYTLKNRAFIEEMTRHSILGDEVFMQVLAYNSPFMEKIFTNANGRGTSKRYTTWPTENQNKKNDVRPDHNLIAEDFEDMMDSGDLFALKFEGPDGEALIEKIKETRGIYNG